MIAETYIDKDSWPDGEWKDEPDHVAWLDAVTGYRCIIRRGDATGALCGYVSVNRSHPYHGKSHNDIDDIDVHGDLTYSELCSATGQWILGFDCAHLGDLCPMSLSSWESYRNITYVRGEVILLKKQLHEKEKINNKGETNMNTKDLKQYKEVLTELEAEMTILKEDIVTISKHVEKTNRQISHIRNVYNFLNNILTTIKLEEKENEYNKNNS